MDQPRFQVTLEGVESLKRQKKVASPLLNALTNLVGQTFNTEREFLEALFALSNRASQSISDEEAATCLRHFDRNFTEALRLLKTAHREHLWGNVAGSIPLYRRSLSLFPMALTHTLLGWAYSFQNRYERGIEECEKALALEPDYGKPAHDIGAYLMAMGHPDEAVAWFQKALAAPRYESPEIAWANMGSALEQAGEKDQALECYLKAHAMDPHQKFPRLAINRLTPDASVIN